MYETGSEKLFEAMAGGSSIDILVSVPDDGQMYCTEYLLSEATLVCPQ